MKKPLTVIKIGSSVLINAQAIPEVIDEIIALQRQNKKVLVVISALGDTTDNLLQSGKAIYKGIFDLQKYPKETATLLANGELTALAFFGLAFAQINIPVTTLCNKYLYTTGDPLNAHPEHLNMVLLEHAFAKTNIVLVPGFLGCNVDRTCTLLGRGGSDLSAIFCAWALKAQECLLIKDVVGVFNCDPNTFGEDADCYQSLRYQDAFLVCSHLIQKQALHFAKTHQLKFIVKSMGPHPGTLVGAETTTFYSEFHEYNLDTAV